MNQPKILLVLFISIFFVYCSPNSKTKKPDKYSDTAYAFKVCLDSFYKTKYHILLDPDKYRKDIILSEGHWAKPHFESNPFKDSLIFLNDAIFAKYIPLDRYKLKLLTKEQICNLIYEFQKKGKNFLAVIQIKYNYFKDSTYSVLLDNNFPFYTKEISGNYKEKVGGGYYSGSDTCKFFGDCMSTFSLNFTKSKLKLYVKK